MRIRIGKLPLDILSLPEILAKIEELINSGNPHQIVTLNSFMYSESLKDIFLREAINNASLVVPDSTGIVIATLFLHGIKIRRIAGIDLMLELCRLSSKKKYNIFLFGSQYCVVEKTANRLKELFPGLCISGFQDGYFDKNGEMKKIDLIKKAKTDILFVGLSLPQQEKWIYKNLSNLNIRLVMGVGGSFDVVSGKLSRAPIWMRITGIEWLFRLIQEPFRIKRFFYALRNFF